MAEIVGWVNGFDPVVSSLVTDFFVSITGIILTTSEKPFTHPTNEKLYFIKLKICMEGNNMKVILSRKGFDSKNGGYPNPILPDGRMVSLPIPIKYEHICYNNLRLRDTTYYSLMKRLNVKIHYNLNFVQ